MVVKHREHLRKGIIKRKGGIIGGGHGKTRSERTVNSHLITLSAVMSYFLQEKFRITSNQVAAVKYLKQKPGTERKLTGDEWDE